MTDTTSTEEVGPKHSQGEILNKIEDPRVREQVAGAWDRDAFNRSFNELFEVNFMPASTPMPPNDPAQVLLRTGHTTTPTVFREKCYICQDPEFAQMGLPLCFACAECGGHVAADDVSCDDCGLDQRGFYEGNDD